MSYHSNKKLNFWTGRFRLLKGIVVAMILTGTLVNLSGCSLLTTSLDNRTGFSQHLGQVEHNIRSEDWDQAITNLDHAKKAWTKLKPPMQIDIDHDYIKDIEDGFAKLDGYLDTQDKSNSLVSILLIEDTWKNINSR